MLVKFRSNLEEEVLKPFIKWPGGKSEELKVITKHLPPNIDRYFEPFVGGGAVYFGIENIDHYSINDKSLELMNLYREIKEQNIEFLNAIIAIDNFWRLLDNVSNKYMVGLIEIYSLYSSNQYCEYELKSKLDVFLVKYLNDLDMGLSTNFIINEKKLLETLQNNLTKKMMRMKKLENQLDKLQISDVQANIETGMKSGFYTYLRFLYNNHARFNLSSHFASAIYYFVREYCYSSMFRYNSKGEFNVPYGGISYNKKYLSNKIEYITSEEVAQKMQKTKMSSLDFEEFLNKNNLSKDDFVFLDPPYDSSFSTYANNVFNSYDHTRLADFCKNTNAKFMLVVKNTDFIYNLYKEFNMISFDKKYAVSFQNRNEREAEHLLITNYVLMEGKYAH